MNEEQRQDLQQQIAELRELVIQNFKEKEERELKLVNALKHIKIHTWQALHGSTEYHAYLEARNVLDELYPVNKNV